MRLSPRTTRHSVDDETLLAGRYLQADGTLVPIMGTVTRLGRSLNADVEIDDPSVSRRHALIVRQDGQTYVLDDGSRNGTWHNGIRVDRAVLRDGDTVGLGVAQLRYVEVVETATEPVELIAA
jgi:pSer/pThr/pTyr-binding forkhead associated (FHA) protein